VRLITKHSDELPDLDQNAKELIADGVWSMFENSDPQSDIKYVIVVFNRGLGPKVVDQRFFLDKTGNVLSLSSSIELDNPVMLHGVKRTGVIISI
jgi:hypothetical protein